MTGGSLPPDGTVAIAGASLAGLRAAQGLRDNGFAGSIVMVGEEQHPPYDRPPLSKQVLAGAWPPERTALAAPDALAAMGLELRLGCRVLSLDAGRRLLSLDDGSELRADGVVIATGARPRRMPGTEDHPAVTVLRTLEDVRGLRHALDEAGPGCRVVVVGAGFIGSEVAATCAGLGCRVTVLEGLPAPLAPALGEDVGAALGAMHARNGVTLRTRAIVEGIDRPAGGGAEVVLAGGDRLAADVVVVGIGVVPATDWLAGSGLTVADGVVCDHRLFAADRVVAAGDLARWQWRHAGEERSVRIEHWETAAQMGAAAGAALLAGRDQAPPFDPVPYFWSDQYGLRIQVLGRPDPTDEVAVVEGSLDAQDGKFVALYGRGGRLTAALAVSRPRLLMAFRPLLVAGAGWDEALAVLRP